MSSQSTMRAAGLLLGLALVLAGCGDDVNSADEPTTTTAGDTGDTTTTTEATSSTTTTAADDEEAAGDFCEAAPAVDVALAADEPDPETVEQALVDVEAAAPEELSDEVATVTDAVRRVMETQDFEIFSEPELQEANLAVNDYLVSDCGFSEVDITAVEYAFQGLPETVSTGPTAVYLRNEGQEFHEAVMFRINDDVTQSVEELLALPQEEAQTMTEFVGATFAAPGSASATSIELTEPGRYAVVCFVPVGMTPEALEAMGPEEEPQGPPHFTQGMFQEFTVE